jgi:hypothetical protein
MAPLYHFSKGLRVYLRDVKHGNRMRKCGVFKGSNRVPRNFRPKSAEPSKELPPHPPKPEAQFYDGIANEIAKLI